jgi:tetratricopeptide (TPR) repeat protein
MESRRRALIIFAATFSYVLAIASKESAVILPVVCGAYGWAYAKDFRSFLNSCLRRWKAILPAILAVTAFAAWELWSIYRVGETTVGLHRWRQTFHYLLAQFQVFASYLRLILWPSGLTIEHDFQPSPPGSLYAVACMALLALAIALVVRMRRRNPEAALLGASFLIFLAPTSTLIPSADLMFEHRLYLPMIPGSALLGWALLALGRSLAVNKRTRIAVPASLVVALLTVYGVLSWRRVQVWADGIRLWEEAAAKAPASVRSHYNLGVALLPTDRERSRAAFVKTLQLRPAHAAALYNLGWIEQSGGRLDSARRYYLASLEADASFWKAHQNMANLAVLRGALAEARVHYEAVIRSNPDYPPAYESLAAILEQLGDRDAALAVRENLRLRGSLQKR